MSLLRDTAHARAGADPSNRALMYSPTTLENGSSVSHWDKSAFPNLLMEPVINSDLTHNLDMTVPLLKDIGWASTPPPAPKDSGGCSTGVGPPAPWLALLGIVALVRRRRRA
jgi:MYXO-CTERM domain-containing protein